MLLSLLLAPPAHATCDPANPEDGLDAVDDDCDGSPAIRRDYVNAMSSDIVDHFVLTEAGQVNGEVIFLPTTGQATMELGYPIPWDSGEGHVVLNLLNNTTAGCDIWIEWDSGFLGSALSLGLNDIDFPVGPGDEIFALDITCEGSSGVATLDWLTVQNGPYDFAPAEDLYADFDTMAAPGGGRMSVVRKTELDEYFFAGSDVGGFA